MSSATPNSAPVLRQLLESADEFDRAGQKDSALSAAIQAFVALQKQNDVGFVLSAKVAQAFLLRFRELRGFAASLPAIVVAAQVLDTALASDRSINDSYDSGLMLLAQLHAIAGHTVRGASSSVLHYQKAAGVLEVHRDLRLRIDGPKGSLELATTLTELASVLLLLNRHSDSLSVATESMSFLRGLPKEAVPITKMKSNLETLLFCFENNGSQSEAQATASLLGEVTQWMNDI